MKSTFCNFLSLDFDCNLLTSGEVIIHGFSINYIVDHLKSLHKLRVIMSLYKQHHSSGLWVNSNPHASLTGPLSYVTKWPCNHTISMIVYAYIWIPNGSK